MCIYCPHVDTWTHRSSLKTLEYMVMESKWDEMPCRTVLKKLAQEVVLRKSLLKHRGGGSPPHRGGGRGEGVFP